MPRVSPDDELVTGRSHDELLTYRQSAEILRRTTRTVHRLRAMGLLRPVILTSDQHAVQVRFRRGDVEAIRDREAS